MPLRRQLRRLAMDWPPSDLDAIFNRLRQVSEAPDLPELGNVDLEGVEVALECVDSSVEVEMVVDQSKDGRLQTTNISTPTPLCSSSSSSSFASRSLQQRQVMTTMTTTELLSLVAAAVMTMI